MTISLVTSFYNFYDRFLSQWLDAVLSGELPDEIVLLVSGKDYDSKNIQSAISKMGTRVKYQVLYIDHVGMGNARNCAVRAATSEWIMHVGVDDVVTSNAIADIKQHLGDDADILVGNMDWVGHATKSGVRKYALTIESFFGGMTNDHAAYRKAFWEKSPYIEYSGDVDVAFWIGLGRLGVRIGYIDTVITRHFFRPDSVAGKYTKEDMREIRRMTTVWKNEGVHSKRFNDPKYKLRGDGNFTHRTEGM